MINDNLVELANFNWNQIFDKVNDFIEMRYLFNTSYGKTMPKNQLKPSGTRAFGANGQIGFTNKAAMLEDFSIGITSRGSGSGTIQLLDKNIFITNNLLTLVSLNSWNNWFNYFLLESVDIKSAVTGSAQPQLTIENFNYVKVPRATDAMNEEFVKRTTGFEQMYWENIYQNVQLMKVRNALMPKLLNGEIDLDN